ncbi:hypothetical protein [Rhizobium sp. FKL33]|uniref:hypothetical protein n=1 Tax=Rhizobium sp. FKL33 TaxID=2562307 RepID=UPI0010BFEC69|nr:hypothetical protein [Rhizobium sp. FKL33]
MDIPMILAATTAIGTAAYGLVDSSKAFKGGVSNIGYGFVEEALQPFRSALELVNKDAPFELAKANWINGMNVADQKIAIKGLIKLGIAPSTAADLAEAAPGVNPASLLAISAKLETGAALDDAELALLARLEGVIDARLDAAFERADQRYRNSAKVIAAAVAVVISEIGAFSVVTESGQGGFLLFVQAFGIGIIAAPLAPIAKDLTSAITAASASFKTITR